MHAATQGRWAEHAIASSSANVVLWLYVGDDVYKQAARDVCEKWHVEFVLWYIHVVDAVDDVDADNV